MPITSSRIKFTFSCLMSSFAPRGAKEHREDKHIESESKFKLIIISFILILQKIYISCKQQYIAKQGNTITKKQIKNTKNDNI